MHPGESQQAPWGHCSGTRTWNNTWKLLLPWCCAGSCLLLWVWGTGCNPTAGAQLPAVLGACWLGTWAGCGANAWWSCPYLRGKQWGGCCCAGEDSSYSSFWPYVSGSGVCSFEDHSVTACSSKEGSGNWPYRFCALITLPCRQNQDMRWRWGKSLTQVWAEYVCSYWWPQFWGWCVQLCVSLSFRPCEGSTFIPREARLHFSTMNLINLQ